MDRQKFIYTTAYKNGYNDARYLDTDVRSWNRNGRQRKLHCIRMSSRVLNTYFLWAHANNFIRMSETKLYRMDVGRRVLEASWVILHLELPIVFYFTKDWIWFEALECAETLYGSTTCAPINLPSVKVELVTSDFVRKWFSPLKRLSPLFTFYFKYGLCELRLRQQTLWKSWILNLSRDVGFN